MENTNELNMDSFVTDTYERPKYTKEMVEAYGQIREEKVYSLPEDKKYVMYKGKKRKVEDYIYFDEETNRYALTPEQTVVDEVEKHYWKNSGKTIFKDWRLYLMLIPMIFIFFCWRYLPMYELLGSFKSSKFYINNVVTNKVADQYFVGFNNFKQVLFGSYKEGFWQAFRNTFVISFYGLLFGFPFPIILALFFNEIKSNIYRSVLQVLTYLPKFISTVIITSLVIMLVSGIPANQTNPGIITQALRAIGLISDDIAQKGLLGGSSEYFRSVYIISGIWEGAGYGSIVYFAAIIAVSPTSYEAAQIDGAGKFQQMRYVVLPAILSTIVIMLIVRIGTLLSVGYEQVILLKDWGGNTALNETGQVVSTLALSWKGLDIQTVPEFLNNVVSMLLVIGANVISRKASGTSLY